MSTEAPNTGTQTPDNPNRDRRPSRRKKLVAAAAAFAVTAGGVVAYESFGHDNEKTVVSYTDHPGKPTPGHHNKPKPVNLERGRQVSEEQREALRASTVQVVSLKPDPKTGFSIETFCTGTVVDINGVKYVLTGGHCLVKRGKDTKAAFSGLSRHDAQQDPSLNTPHVIPKSLSGEISIWRIGANGKPDAKHPIPVDEAVALEYPDIGLLSSPAGSGLDDIPAMPYPQAQVSMPKPGTELALRNADGLGGDFSDETGIYAGRVPLTDYPKTDMDWAVVPKGSIVIGNSGELGVFGGDGLMLTGPQSVTVEPYAAPDYASRLGITFDSHHDQLVGFAATTDANVDSLVQALAQ